MPKKTYLCGVKSNWFQSDQAATLFERYIRVVTPHTHCVAQLQGCAHTKRAIIQAGFAADDAATADDVTAMMHQLAADARRQHCVYAEMRCMDDYSAYRTAIEQAGWIYEPHYDILIDITQPIPETKMRQIRAAERQGYSWREATSEADVTAWYQCLSHLYRTKVRRPLPSLAFFLRAFRSGLPILVVEKVLKVEGVLKVEKVLNVPTIVGGVLLVPDTSRAYEWYICGQVMSTYAAIEWCRAHGIDCFDTMGAGSPDQPYGVRDFKLQMGGILYEWGRYRYLCSPFLYRLGRWFIRTAGVWPEIRQS